MNNIQDATINHCILWCNTIQGESTVLTLSSEMQGVSTHILLSDIPYHAAGTWKQVATCFNSGFFGSELVLVLPDGHIAVAVSTPDIPAECFG
jgi:hypothetical protein